MNNWQEKLKLRLKNIYNEQISDNKIVEFEMFIQNNLSKQTKNNNLWNEEDIALITYGDSFIKPNETPLTTLSNFANLKLANVINIIHILPFFPFSSDDGFSVIDFEMVNPELGTWDDIKNLSDNYKLMADLVINHASSKSQWFQNYLKGSGEGVDYFIEESPDNDLSMVTRPRSTPILTNYETNAGTKHVWTTFSADQIDLNFSNPDVLLRFLKILHMYIKNGSTIIRLDAIAFLWKKVGTTCLHLPQTHEVVKLLRDFSEWVAPGTIILTETNVPNKENLSYFGNNDEAHMVYQFSLPPLLLHALNSGNGSYLTEWAMSLPEIAPECTFFNFTSSHDGIGVRPLEGLLPDEEKQLLFEDIKKSGGLISMKRNTDGSESPYELNITYYDALKRTRVGEDGLQEKRFVCSQLVMLAMKGLPAFYVHSLLASPNYTEGVNKTGRYRTINREKLDFDAILEQLESDTSRGRVFSEICRLIKIRKKQKAFHPSAGQTIINLNHTVFAILRKYKNDDQLLSIHNLTASKNEIELPNSLQAFKNDIIENKIFKNKLTLKPYQTLWLIKG